MARDPFKDRRTCRGCGCHDLRACPGGCSWIVMDLTTPSGVCSTCAVKLQFHPVLLDVAGTSAADDIEQSIFAHLACRDAWPPAPQILVPA